MEYQKIINLLDNKPNQSSEFRTKTQVNIMMVHRERVTPTTNSQTEFKTTVLNLCDYSDAYMVIRETITLFRQGATATSIQAHRNDQQVIFKDSATFTNCITETDNT